MTRELAVTLRQMYEHADFCVRDRVAIEIEDAAFAERDEATREYLRGTAVSLRFRSPARRTTPRKGAQA